MSLMDDGEARLIEKLRQRRGTPSRTEQVIVSMIAYLGGLWTLWVIYSSIALLLSH